MCKSKCLRVVLLLHFIDVCPSGRRSVWCCRPSVTSLVLLWPLDPVQEGLIRFLHNLSLKISLTLCQEKDCGSASRPDVSHVSRPLVRSLTPALQDRFPVRRVAKLIARWSWMISPNQIGRAHV